MPSRHQISRAGNRSLRPGFPASFVSASASENNNQKSEASPSSAPAPAPAPGQGGYSTYLYNPVDLSTVPAYTDLPPGAYVRPNLLRGPIVREFLRIQALRNQDTVSGPGPRPIRRRPIRPAPPGVQRFVRPVLGTYPRMPGTTVGRRYMAMPEGLYFPDPGLGMANQQGQGSLMFARPLAPAQSQPPELVYAPMPQICRQEPLQLAAKPESPPAAPPTPPPPPPPAPPVQKLAFTFDVPCNAEYVFFNRLTFVNFMNQILPQVDIYDTDLFTLVADHVEARMRQLLRKSYQSVAGRRFAGRVPPGHSLVNDPRKQISAADHFYAKYHGIADGRQKKAESLEKKRKKEEEEARNRQANEAAFAALGKKRRLNASSTNPLSADSVAGVPQLQQLTPFTRSRMWISMRDVYTALQDPEFVVKCPKLLEALRKLTCSESDSGSDV